MGKWLLAILFVIGMATTPIHGAEEADGLGKFVGEGSAIQIGGPIEAEFRALVIDDFFHDSGTSPDFTLKGSKIRLETDTVSSVNGPATVAPEPSTEIEYMEDYTITGHDNRKGHSATVIAENRGANIQIDYHCSEMEPAQHAQMTPELYVDHSRNTMNADLTNTVDWKNCTSNEVHLVVEGSYVVSLWEWDIVAISPSGERSTTKSGETPPDEEVEALYPYVSERRQIWLFVEDGDLTIPLADSAQLFMSNMIAQDGNATIVNPTGKLSVSDREITISGNQLELDGSLEFEMQGRKNAVMVGARGNFEEVDIDGESVLDELAVSIDTDSSFPDQMGWALISIVILVLGTTTYILGRPAAFATRDVLKGETSGLKGWKEFKAYGYEKMGKSLMDKGKPRRAAKYFTKSLDLNNGYNTFVMYERAVAFTQMREYEKAFEDHSFLDHLLKNDTPPGEEIPSIAVDNAEQAARVSARIGRRDQAVWWIQRLLNIHPETYRYFDEEPDFACLQSDLRFQELVEACREKVEERSV